MKGGESVKMRILGIGHSHISAIWEAAKYRSRSDVSLEILNLRKFEPLRKSEVYSIKGEVEEFIKKGAELIFSTIGGNTHNVLGLLKHPQPFDFVLPGREELPFEKNAKLISFDILKERVELQASHKLAILSMVKAVIGNQIPIYHVESPPPIENSEYIISKLDGCFRQTLKQRGIDNIEKNVIASSVLRYKLWRLHSQIFQEHCCEEGISFINVPAEAMSNEGFLLKEFWSHSDVTHANQLYGECILKQLEEKLKKEIIS